MCTDRDKPLMYSGIVASFLLTSRNDLCIWKARDVHEEDDNRRDKIECPSWNALTTKSVSYEFIQYQHLLLSGREESTPEWGKDLIVWQPGMQVNHNVIRERP